MSFKHNVHGATGKEVISAEPVCVCVLQLQVKIKLRLEEDAKLILLGGRWY